MFFYLQVPQRKSFLAAAPADPVHVQQADGSARVQQGRLRTRRISSLGQQQKVSQTDC